jgi:HD-like signal output (HDOD) protein
MASEFPVNSDVANVIAALPNGVTILAEVSALQSGDTQLRDMADALTRNAELCGDLVGVANNGLSHGEQPVDSIEAAVARLGQREVFRLGGALAWRQFTECLGSLYGISADELWRSGVFTALLMGQLAPAADVDSNAAYMAGLFRSVGKVVLSELARRTAEIPPYKEGDETLPEWEESLLGYTNIDVAAAALDLWHLPIEIATAVRCHYASGENAPMMARLLNIAAGAADLRGYGFPGEEEFWRVTPQRLTACNLDRESLAAAEAITATEFTRVLSALGVTSRV